MEKTTNLKDKNVSKKKNDKKKKKKRKISEIKKVNRKRFIIFSFIVLFFVFLFGSLLYFDFSVAKKYSNVVLPNIYLDNYDMSNKSFEKVLEYLDIESKRLLDKKVVLVANFSEYEFNLEDIGIVIDKEKTIKAIKDYQKSLSLIKRSNYINREGKSKNFDVFYKVDKDKNVKFLGMLKDSTNVAAGNGYFDTSDGVKYVAGTNGYTLNVSMSSALIKNYFDNKIYRDDLKVELLGEVTVNEESNKYSSIDTMTSSFVTKYDTWVSQRAQNLRTGVNYINGAIIEPGEVFSFHKYAGPYNKEGYVFYYEFFGNGVCQVATTVYNAALLGGLEIVKRSPHDKKSVYVDGGLDATVADYVTWNVDMQWKNTYDYPIYLKAYDTDGEIHVEFWSNHDAKKGYTYSTESVWLGGRSYQAYLHVYKDGEEVDVRHIDNTYYIKD